MSIDSQSGKNFADYLKLGEDCKVAESLGRYSYEQITDETERKILNAVDLECPFLPFETEKVQVFKLHRTTSENEKEFNNTSAQECESKLVDDIQLVALVFKSSKQTDQTEVVLGGLMQGVFQGVPAHDPDVSEATEPGADPRQDDEALQGEEEEGPEIKLGESKEVTGPSPAEDHFVFPLASQLWQRFDAIPMVDAGANAPAVTGGDAQSVNSRVTFIRPHKLRSPRWIGRWEERKDLKKDEVSGDTFPDKPFGKLSEYLKASRKVADAQFAALRAKKLSCYKNVWLCEVAAATECRLKVEQTYVLLDSNAKKSEKAVIPLNGTSPPIHKLNALEGRLDLSTPEKAVAYLEFFCWAVNGEEGAFRVIRRFADLRWKGRPKPDDYKNIIESLDKQKEAQTDGEYLTSLEPIPDEADEAKRSFWLLEEFQTKIQYSDAFFQADFKINKATGMVEMLEDDPVAIKLAVSPDDLTGKHASFGSIDAYAERKEPAKKSEIDTADKEAQERTVFNEAEELDKNFIEFLRNQLPKADADKSQQDKSKQLKGAYRDFKNSLAALMEPDLKPNSPLHRFLERLQKTEANFYKTFSGSEEDSDAKNSG